MKKSFLMLLITICLFCTSVSAVNAEYAYKNYFDLKVGGYFPQGDILKDGDAGLGTEFAFGHYFSKNIAAELGVGYFQAKVPVFTSFGTEVDALYRIFPVMLNLVISSRTGKFEPFAKAGVEWYLTEIDVPFDTKNDSTLGYQFAVGALLGDFGIEGKYLIAKTTMLNTDVDLNGFTATIFYRFRF